MIMHYRHQVLIWWDELTDCWRSSGTKTTAWCTVISNLWKD